MRTEWRRTGRCCTPEWMHAGFKSTTDVLPTVWRFILVIVRGDGGPYEMEVPVSLPRKKCPCSR